MKSGLKPTTTAQSPSMRREWIEMCFSGQSEELLFCLPPCGGSGLKYALCPDRRMVVPSPSMRREWIEMITDEMYSLVDGQVSLHAEGVD